MAKHTAKIAHYQAFGSFGLLKDGRAISFLVVREVPGR